MAQRRPLISPPLMILVLRLPFWKISTRKMLARSNMLYCYMEMS